MEPALGVVGQPPLMMPPAAQVVLWLSCIFVPMLVVTTEVLPIRMNRRCGFYVSRCRSTLARWKSKKGGVNVARTDTLNVPVFLQGGIASALSSCLPAWSRAMTVHAAPSLRVVASDFWTFFTFKKLSSMQKSSPFRYPLVSLTLSSPQ